MNPWLEIFILVNVSGSIIAITDPKFDINATIIAIMIIGLW